MWATRGVRESPAHRQSTFLVLEVFAAGTKPRALNSLHCPDDGNARPPPENVKDVETAQTVQKSGGGTQQTENSSSSTPFFFFILQQQPESVGMNEMLGAVFTPKHH